MQRLIPVRGADSMTSSLQAEPKQEEGGGPRGREIPAASDISSSSSSNYGDEGTAELT